MPEEMFKVIATPNPVGFLLDRSELEILAVHYFILSLEYDYDQFAFPGEPIPSSEWYEDRVAYQRLCDISAVLGSDEMNRLSAVAQADFRKRYPKITDQNWADFKGPVGGVKQAVSVDRCGPECTCSGMEEDEEFHRRDEETF